jgi:hypothetical protein
MHLAGCCIQKPFEKEGQKFTGEKKSALFKITCDFSGVPMHDPFKKFGVVLERNFRFRFVISGYLTTNALPELLFIRWVYFPGRFFQPYQFKVAYP